VFEPRLVRYGGALRSNINTTPANTTQEKQYRDSTVLLT
jgi:hypothetical protein